MESTSQQTGIISQSRVKQFGEVFTPDTIVNDMLYLVDEQLDTELEKYISTTYLEPACGDGQFLVRILSRKLERVKQLSQTQRVLALVKSLCSIYGVDIQADNVKRARERMFAIATGKSVETFDLDNKTQVIQVDLEITYSSDLLKTIQFIIDKNIIVGNTLDKDNPVILTDYKFKADKVYTTESPLNDLTLEINKTSEVNYLNLYNICQGTEDDDDFDF